MLNIEEALKLTEKAGASEAEVYYLSARSITIDMKKDTIEVAKESSTEGIGVRAIVNGAIGYASTNNSEKIADATQLSVKSAKIRQANPKWKSLPSHTHYPAVKGLYDKNIEQITVETCIEHALEIIRGATSIPGTTPTSGGFTCAVASQQILNSNNVNVSEHTTAASGYIETISKKGEQSSTAYDFDISRHINKINFYEVGKQAARLSKQSLHPVTIKPSTQTILLQPIAIADLVEHTLIPSFSAENVQKKRSSLEGKLHTRIASEHLKIIDDGLLQEGLNSSTADDEGSPSKTTKVIQNGTLCSYLYDKYTADQENVRSTANAIRHSYNHTPSISTRNFIIEHPASDIITETKTGVIINNLIGAHTANPITGDFSVEARNAFTINRGSVDKPIKSMMIAGNIFELLKNISGAGDDIRNLGNIITPTIRVDNVRVIG